ncbi:MAG: hypothetical protein IJZ74_04840 [Clostridia bacterium]|nr:hypothetical protein [Clostridia bacterium]
MNKNDQRSIEAMLRELPRTADQTLGGLTAGPHLKARIERAAQNPAPAASRFALPRWTPALCCAAALALFIALNPIQLQQPEELITAGPLGPIATDSPVAAANLTADLGDSDIQLSRGNSKPGYRSIWAASSNGSFPLIGINGRYYRMLTSPLNVDPSLMGSTVGTIAEFTTEPSLSGTDVVLSNAVAFGQPVYEIRGMADTLVTAEVNGQMRLFQRVSFNGNARRGSESLADTLEVSGRVIAMELSGVGTITDPGVCSRLLETLFDCASYESSGSISSRQSLLIELDSGLVVQMAVKSDRLAACGTWSCPEFFEAFVAACE